MDTLIELYDERPLENVLGVETFRPNRVVYVCPENVARDTTLQNKLRLFFKHRGLNLEVIFFKARMFDVEAMVQIFHRILDRYPDCAVDITGGTDAVLYAAGFLGKETGIPTFTYSRRRNCFFDIRNARFAESLPCRVTYSVEDCFLMAGAAFRQGRVDNRILGRYLSDVEPLFRVYLAHRSEWVRLATYLQRVSPSPQDGSAPDLRVRGGYTVKGERGGQLDAPEAALRDLAAIGALKDLEIEAGSSVSFTFRDGQLRTWLRDIGSVLELYVYKTCLDTGLFDDVRLSAVVDWEGSEDRNAVTNELDVVCTKGVIPVFISCKTGEVRTEALNELAVLRDRFGGKMARAAVVTGENGNAPMRNRAAELRIQVIDRSDLETGKLSRRIQELL